MNKSYKGLIWTNHAIEKLSERSVKQSDAWATFSRPDNSKYAETKGAWVYERTINNQKIKVVAKKNDEGKWVVLSVWSKKI